MNYAEFHRRSIDPQPLADCNAVLLTADIAGLGQADVVLGAKYHSDETGQRREGEIVWYRHGTWERHVIGLGQLEAGGVALPLGGGGRIDLVAGEEGKGRNLFWWENPGHKGGDPRRPWLRRLITNGFERYHDQAAGDVDGDGRAELVVLSQNAGKLVYFDVPADPRVEPWPAACCHVVADDVVLEGLAVADLDGNGANEILAGHLIFRPPTPRRRTWQRAQLVPDFRWARVAVADLNGDGCPDIVLAESECPGARLVWVEGPAFKKVHPLGDDFSHLHSLAVADFNGDGHPDIFTAEMQLPNNGAPRIVLFLNDGQGKFFRHEIDNAGGTHESRLIHLAGSRLPSILIKPYAPHSRLELLENVTPVG